MDNTNKGAGVLQKSSRSLIFFSSLSLILPLVLVSFLSVSADTSNSVPAKNQILATYGRLPLSFEANHGQTDAQVQFLSRGRGYSLFLTPAEAVLVLRKADGTRQQASEKTDSALRTQNSELSSVLRMKLTGANSQPQVSGLSELPGKVNYFIGNDAAKWRTNVPTYAKVKYAGVYPGVDVVYYGNQGQLEYDFVVAPGADPKAIQLSMEGAENLELDEKGDLVLQIAGGELRLRKPLVYQEIGGVRKEISAAYVLTPGAEAHNQESKSGPAGQNPKLEVGFQVASYDASKPLIIDPVLVYSTYLGGSGADQGSSIAVDNSGNAYVTGFTQSASFPTPPLVPPGPAPFDVTLGGATDVFVTKLNSTGSALVYSTYLGGSTDDQGLGIAVDGSGNAYVTGTTNSSNFPMVNAVQPKKSGTASASDAFVTKLNSTGSALLYSTYLGGSQDESGNGIVVDGTGIAYVVGQTKSTNFPIKNALRGKNGGVTDVFIGKLNPSLVGAASLLFATYLGGSGDDTGTGIDVDDLGNVYITGETVSSNFPTTTGAFDTSFNGLVDAFVAKLNPAGSALLYSTYLGGSGTDRGRGIAVETLTSGCAAGCAYVTGSTDSAGLATIGAYDITNIGQDAFVAKLKLTGTGASDRVYFTYLGGGGSDIGNGIVVDSSGSIYVTGSTDSAGMTPFPTSNAVQPFSGGGTDAFITKLDVTGSSLVYSTYLGGSAADQGFGIALDASLNVYVTGSTTSPNFPTASFQGALGGGTDAFVTKLSPNTPPVLSGVPTAATINELVSYTFTATATDSDIPAQTLTFSLVGAPTGATIGASTGMFNWTPGEAQGPGKYSFTVRVSDGVANTDAGITITVNEVNTAPSLAAIGNKSLNELTLLSFTATGSDTDVPAQTLTYSLANGTTSCGSVTSCTVPSGASIVSGTGAFTWTPTEAEGPGTYRFKVVVTDNGTPNLSASEEITVTVNEVNTSPTLAAIGNKSLNELTLLSFTAAGSDTDVPAQTLAYTLANGTTSCGSVTSCTVPSEASIVSGTGAFTWTPTEAEGPGTYRFKVVVTDSGTPNLSASEEITVTVDGVNEKPVASANPAGLTIDEDAAVTAATTVALSGTDAETALENLVFTITQAPANGVIKLGATTLLFGSTFIGSPTDVTYQPNANFNGADRFKFKVTDTGDGSSAALDSDEVTVAITVNAVNDPPFFDPILDQSPTTDVFVSQTIDVGITGVSPGAPDEVGQAVTLTAAVTSSSPAGLVTIVTNPLPGTDPTRTLSYQIPANTTGTATIRITANDGQSANNTFFRDVSVTVGTDPVAAAAITGLTLGSAFVNYKVTFNPVDRNGDGTIDSLDCYSVFPPQPQDNPYNLFPSNALVTPEAPPAVVADTFDTLGFGTTQVCTTPKIFEGVIDLSVWGITELGGLTVDFTYVNAVRDPELTAVINGTAVCNDNPTTCQNILVGSFPAGSIAFTFGGTVAEINTVLLHSVELHSGNSSKKPLADVEVRVFNRDDQAFQNQVFVVNGKKVKVGQNPSGSLYGALFEDRIVKDQVVPPPGLIAHCHTPGSGICLTTETQTGNYLVIIKFVDSDVTHDGGKIVYEGETISATSFLDTSVPPDGTGDTAQLSFEIIRKNNNGVFQEYQGGSKTVVCNLSSPSCVP
jgi:hypothetical protein